MTAIDVTMLGAGIAVSLIGLICRKKMPRRMVRRG
jgi:hypothetical protein